jgi:nitrite reductase/ring-hydroxylating ferredoxin subunit
MEHSMPCNPLQADTHASQSCEQCPVVTSRRAFLRDAAAVAAAAVAAVSIARPGMAFAQTVAEIEPKGTPASALPERSYAIPSANSVSVDPTNEVILARWEDRVYAFSIKCPHKGALLEWRESEERVYCPRHEARFLGDGSHFSGRSTRDLDRYGIRRVANDIVVDLGALCRRDMTPTRGLAVVAPVIHALHPARSRAGSGATSWISPTDDGRGSSSLFRTTERAKPRSRVARRVTTAPAAAAPPLAGLSGTAPSEVPRRRVEIPASIQAEHEEIHTELVAATKAPGAWEAARPRRVLHPHFVREEEIALPPLGLLAPLAAAKPRRTCRRVSR